MAPIRVQILEVLPFHERSADSLVRVNSASLSPIRADMAVGAPAGYGPQCAILKSSRLSINRFKNIGQIQLAHKFVYPIRDLEILEEATHSPALIRLPAPSATNESIDLHFSSQFSLNAVARRREMGYSICN
jgi:hypothetical protein